jgi:hypothetical protein
VLYTDTDRPDLELRLISLSLRHHLIDLTACVANLATSDACHRLTQSAFVAFFGRGAINNLRRASRCDLPLGVDMLYRTRRRYPWLEMQTIYPLTDEGIGNAVADAMEMVKSTTVPWAELAE